MWNGHLPGTADYWCQLPGWYLCDSRMPFAYTSSTPAPFMTGFSGLSNGSTIPLAHGAISSNGSTSQTIIARSVDLLEQVLTGAPKAPLTVAPKARPASTTAARMAERTPVVDPHHQHV